MKPKKIEIFTVFLLMLTLCVVILVAGCEKDEINSNNKGIVGTWQLVQLPENCVGFGDEVIEITSDSVFKRYIDDELNFSSVFSVKTGSFGYDTIFFHNPNANYEYEEIALLSEDTLHIIPPILTALATCNYFKRKK